MTQPSMHRSRRFRPEREPLKHIEELKLKASRVRGPLSFANPIHAHFQPLHLEKHSSSVASSEAAAGTKPPSKKHSASGIEYKWTSRNNRKGRHALRVDPTVDPSIAGYLPPESTSRPRTVLRNIIRMFTYFPIWDISYDVAVIFTLGSVLWIFNAFFVYLPLAQPSTEFSTEILYGGGITAFIGATIFEIGSFFLMAEAVNENRTGCFGWALEQVVHEHEKGGLYRLSPSKAACIHHHANKGNLLGRAASNAHRHSITGDAGQKSWTFFPTYRELRTHYLYDIGFLASFSQLLGATIFWIAGFTALPGINDTLSPGLLDGIYWTPQVVGGLGFIVSGTLFMLETQPKWYRPAPAVLGWHVGLWNLVGGVGFTLSPAFGYDTHSWAQYQAALSTFWGSWAFLIGSVLQWYESLDKHPVEVVQGKGDPAGSSSSSSGSEDEKGSS